MAGVFITFEGPDGAGKTTQLKLLDEYLRSRGFAVRLTREPGGTQIGDKIRALLLDPANSMMDARAEALLYMAARAQHVAEVIKPALSRGEVVISDRFSDSTIVYQGVARRLSREDLIDINGFATVGVSPDLTILIDGEPESLRGRMMRRGGKDRIEQEDLTFHRQVRDGFLKLASSDHERIKVIGQGGTIAEVHQTVVKLVEDYLLRRND